MIFDIFLAQSNNNKIPFSFFTSKVLEIVVVETAPSEERYTDKLFQAVLQIVGNFHLGLI